MRRSRESDSAAVVLSDGLSIITLVVINGDLNNAYSLMSLRSQPTGNIADLAP